MSILFFLRGYPQFDVDRPQQAVEESRPAKKKRKRRTYAVRNRKRSIVAKELNYSKETLRLINERVEEQRQQSEKARRQTEVDRVVSIVSMLAYLDEVDR